MRFLKIYLIAAVSICTICTIILTIGCGTSSFDQPSYEKLERKREKVLDETYLLICIISAPKEYEERQNVRNTWLELSKKGPSVYIHKFVIGTAGLDTEIISKLKSENEQFNDLVLLEKLEEGYSGLARKTLSAMQFAFENFRFQYLLKVDVDTFVRITPFLTALKTVQHPMLYWGFLDGRAKPFRKGKWKEPEWNLCDRYLPYQLGGGYVLSYELVKYLAVNSRLFRMYKNEDVSVGAWLAGLDVKYVHDPRFDTEWTSRGCNNEYLVLHKKTSAEMIEMFENLKNKKFLCTKQYQKRPSYVYDFSKPPSECCTRINGSSIP
ncbi:unnamed protein product [Caenorhabditis angaria]|uniref:Hexosyltransferase n=1 Tax=Caenorhabditis angaria TaxID=860376 RepID=A0A9P1IDC4_9PELO|nr:unnamed protein product [Caenorhabditis angaria]